MPKTIIVPLDGSELGERALAPARALAGRMQAAVVLMTSCDGGPADPDRYLAEHAALDGAEVVVIDDRDAVGGIKVLVADRPEPVVCMSTRGRSGVGKAVLGSVARDTLRDVGVPTLLVGPAVEPELATRFETVLVCTDGSDTSKAVVAPIGDWIRQLHLRTWVVQALDPDARRELPQGAGRVLEEAAVFALAQTLMQRDGGGVNWDVLHGDRVADAIVDYAAHLPASLIAMATHGRSGFAQFALGSVAASVVHAAPCPVLVVRPDGLREEE
jgi:nucleotide-binding universal stress UspA family protein